MTDSFSYTGKIFEDSVYLSEFFTHDNVKLFLSYFITHGCVKSGNVTSLFSSLAERKHGEPVKERYHRTINYLEKNGFIVKGETKYKLKSKGRNLILNIKNNGLSCNSETSCVLESLLDLHTFKRKIHADYYAPENHFDLLNEVESGNIFPKGNADLFNRILKKASDDNLVEIIMPPDSKDAWMKWFGEYSNHGNK